VLIVIAYIFIVEDTNFIVSDNIIYCISSAVITS